MAAAAWLNTAWMLSAMPEAWRFQRATRRVAETQTALLAQILHDNRDTAFGQACRFARIGSARDYQAAVPLAHYEDFAPYIERIARGEANVLTREPVELLEPTSGSTGGEKLIPSTRGLRRQFQRAVAVWINDLFRRRPALRQGRAYWSISPAFGPRRKTPCGLPIGFEDDAAYLGTLERFAIQRLLVVPGSAARLPDIDTFRYFTLLHLLRAEDLTLLSVWNPSFLPALLAPLEQWKDRLLDDLERKAKRRAGRLRCILGPSGTLADKLRQVWPRLTLISCWTDAAAGLALPPLRALFPTVEIQGKGLLATEGCVTFPLVNQPAPALAHRSHFFEFQEMGDARCRLAHELERGGRYCVVLTTAGGLYRYQLRDVVEVIGFWNQCPLLRFLGKADRVSDLVGEKLDEAFVREVIETLGVQPRFCLLVPVKQPPHYRLYWQGEPVEAQRVQAGLERNPHYRYACQLRQLQPLELVVLPESVSGWALYEDLCRRRGQKLGDIKPTVLDVDLGEDSFMVSRPTAG